MRRTFRGLASSLGISSFKIAIILVSLSILFSGYTRAYRCSSIFFCFILCFFVILLAVILLRTILFFVRASVGLLFYVLLADLLFFIVLVAVLLFSIVLLFIFC